MKRILVFFLTLFIAASCSLNVDCTDAQDASCTRVLFIGNSYTFVNDLPNTFAQLAEAGKHKVEVGMSAQGGLTFADHVNSTDTLNLINLAKWNYVVLQEQSQIPSVQDSRTYSMYPAARALVQQARDTGATPLFFLTWAHRGGFPENGMPDYESMQIQVNDGYYGIAGELNVPVVPVGSAWRRAVSGRPELTLWQDDGIHPTEQGTYLAACVFYEAIFHESPVGLRYRANLSQEIASILQTVASEIKY